MLEGSYKIVTAWDEEHMPIHLTSTFGNEDFYKTLGFKKHKTGNSKYPFKSDYVED